MTVNLTWPFVRIRDVGAVKSGTTPSRKAGKRFMENGTIPWVKTGDLTNDEVTTTEERVNDIALQECSLPLLSPGTVLVAMYGGYRQIGRTGLTTTFATINQAISAIVVDPDRLLPRFLLHTLNSRISYWRRVAASSRKDPNITRNDVLNFELLLPPLEEQQRIVASIDDWSRASTILSHVLTAKSTTKRTFLQQIITGRLSLQDSDPRLWNVVSLREITAESRTTNTGNLDSSRVMGVSKFNGIVAMRDRTIGTDLKKYKILRPRNFAYNPMRINIGSIARWTGTHDVLVSPDYVVFETTEGKLDDRFLEHYRRSQAWERHIEAAGNGSVRVRIYYDDLAAMCLKIPMIHEQRRIADFLDLLDREIALLEHQRDLLERQKRTVMHKLLTGDTRLQSSPDA